MVCRVVTSPHTDKLLSTQTTNSNAESLFALHIAILAVSCWLTSDSSLLSVAVTLGGPQVVGIVSSALLTSVSYWNNTASSAGISGSIIVPVERYSLGL